MALTEATKEKTGRSELIGAFLFMALAAAFGFFRLRYGVDFGGEGHMLSAPLRYTLGDILFRDEVLNPLRWFDILMAPLMPLLPKNGSVLFLRYVTLIAHFLCIGALLNSLRKYIPLLAIAAIFAATVYSNFCTYWTPTYHTAAADFLFLCLAFWFNGMSARTPRGALLWGLAAGCAFFLAAVCEIPCIALLVVPAGAAARALKKREAQSGFFISTAALLATVCALSLAAFGVLRASGLLPDLIKALDIQRTINVYGGGIGSRLAWILNDLSRAVPYGVFHLIFWFAVTALFSARPQKSRRSFHAAGASAILLLYTAVSIVFISKRIGVNYHQAADYMEGLCLLSMILFPLQRFLRARSWTDEAESGITAVLYIFGLLLHFLLGAICASGLLVGTVVTFPLQFIVLIMTMRRWFTPTRNDAEAVSRSAGASAGWIPMTALCAGIAVIVMAANLYSLSNSEWIWKLDGRFESGKLRGIYVTREQAGDTEAVVGFLEPRLKRGDFLLSFYSNPMLHYLTETRAALPTGFPSRSWPKETRAQFVRDMVGRRRVPRYAVSDGGRGKEPIYAFVSRNYRPVAHFGQYAIWEHY